MPEDLNAVCKLNKQCLAELSSVLHLLNDDQYTQNQSTCSSSVGTHIRHVIDFYHCFFKGVDLGIIDYDNRQRNTAVENSRDLAKDYLNNLSHLLNPKVISSHPDPVRVSACLGIDTTTEVNSSLVRELLFLQGHTTHHLAVVAQLLERNGIQLPGDFAVATSTRVHRKTT